MSIALILNNRDQKAWADAFQEALPGETIEIYPDIKDPAQVSFAVCWLPTQEALDTLTNVRVLQSLGAGVEHMLHHLEIPSDVQVTRIVDEWLTHDMFEFTLGALLGELKNLRLYQSYQDKRIWKPTSYRRVEGISVGILGLGALGGHTAVELAKFGFSVSGWSNSPKALPGVQSFTGVEGFRQMLSQTEFLINLLPLTPKTHHILNRNHLSYLPKGAFLMSLGRGGHLHEEDLLYLLDTEHLSGAFLDVFETEPLPYSHPFWNHPKIRISPHIASMSAPETVVPQIAENFRRMKAGEPLMHLVDVEKGY